jgi:hypothetical protein
MTVLMKMKKLTKNKKTESEHEEMKDVEEANNNQEEEVEYQEVGIQGEYQENQEYQQGNEDNEEVVVEEVGAGRELYPEEKEEQEEKERNEESQSQDGNDSKETGAGLNKIPTLSLNDTRAPFTRLPPLRDQIKVALEEKNFEELDKLTKILLSQNDMMSKKLTRALQVNDELGRSIQAQGAAFGREKFMLLAMRDEAIRRAGGIPNPRGGPGGPPIQRDEALRRAGGIPNPRGGPGGPPLSRPPMKPAMPIPQPQPVRSIPPTGQRYGQMPPVPRPPANSYTQLPLAPQTGYSSRPGYSSSSYQQPSHQPYGQTSHHQSQSHSQSYQQRKSY